MKQLQALSSLHPSLLLPGLIYRSAAMQHIAQQIRRISPGNATVLLTGESGTGKELVAHAIHLSSPRAGAAFIPFNCTTLQPTLLESELFGHRRGAFTGAIAHSTGVIRAAQHGTLLLDEIGDLPWELQPRLLRFLQQGEIHVLGEPRPRQVDVRVIAATNQDLHQLVEQGRFRTDLYYRLNAIELHLPPLRERAADIPLLIEHFLTQHSTRAGKTGITLSREAKAALQNYSWPGNVRELSNEIQRLVLFTESETTAGINDLSAKFSPPSSWLDSLLRLPQATETTPLLRFPPEMSLAEIRTRVEYELLREALRRHDGNVTRCARALQMERQTLRKKMREHGLAPEAAAPQISPTGQKLTSKSSCSPPLKNRISLSISTIYPQQKFFSAIPAGQKLSSHRAYRSTVSSRSSIR